MCLVAKISRISSQWRQRDCKWRDLFWRTTKWSQLVQWSQPQFQGMTDALPCYIHLSVCLLIIDPYSRAPKKNTSHRNEVLPQDTTHLIQRPCYQGGSPCQDPAGNRTTGRPPDHRKETQTAVVWSRLLFIRSGQNHLARRSERGEEDKADRGRGGDSIREWTGLEVVKSRRALEDWEK